MGSTEEMGDKWIVKRKWEINGQQKSKMGDKWIVKGNGR